MPIVTPTYQAPFGLGNGHVQTILPALFRKVPLMTKTRERIVTPDDDFLDLDWDMSLKADRVAIISHGLEGDSHNNYVQGMAAALHRAGWDTLAWNFRGCSGEPNRQLRSYHSGATEDLHAVVQHVLTTGRYQRVALIGFSLGGNMTLKYLGEAEPDPRISHGVAFSVPCELAASSHKLESLANRIYMRRFLQALSKKIQQKMEVFPGQVSDTGLETMRTFREFDGAYTAPLHGFASAEDYWARASSAPMLGRISIPTLLVNARNDPFLPEACFPWEAARQSRSFFLEAPKSGGHVGFIAFNSKGEYWSETRAMAFLEKSA